MEFPDVWLVGRGPAASADDDEEDRAQDEHGCRDEEDGDDGRGTRPWTGGSGGFPGGGGRRGREQDPVGRVADLVGLVPDVEPVTLGEARERPGDLPTGGDEGELAGKGRRVLVADREPAAQFDVAGDPSARHPCSPGGRRYAGT